MRIWIIYVFFVAKVFAQVPQSLDEVRVALVKPFWAESGGFNDRAENDTSWQREIPYYFDFNLHGEFMRMRIAEGYASDDVKLRYVVFQEEDNYILEIFSNVISGGLSLAQFGITYLSSTKLVLENLESGEIITYFEYNPPR